MSGPEPAHSGHSASSAHWAAPFLGFAAAARGTVRHLNRQFPGMSLWLVTSVMDDRQRVVATAGEWTGRAPAGTEFTWEASLCVRMVRSGTPALVLDTAADPVYRRATIGPLASVRSYVGVPLVLEDGELFGTLCAFGRQAPPAEWRDTVMATVIHSGRLLSTVLAGEHAARERSLEAARAYALADRDPLTRLRNRRGFDDGLRAEQRRSQRFGTRSSIVALSLRPPRDGLPVSDDAVRRCAEVLEAGCRAGDVAARTDRYQFALLATEADLLDVRAREARLREALRSAGVLVHVGAATRRPGEDLSGTYARAQGAMRADAERRRPRVRPPDRDAGR